MELAYGIDRKVLICDIEVFKKMFDVGCYDPDTKEWIEFEVSRRKNDLTKFVKFYTSNKYDFMVTFNGMKYDQQVLQYVVDKHESWYDLTGEEIAALIRAFSDKIIDDMNYGIQPKYREGQFSIFPIDLRLVNHFDNEAKMVSLKWCEFMMNMAVEECSVPFTQKELSDVEIDNIRSYRRHDVMATLGLLYVTLGQPDKVEEVNGGIPVGHLSDYKGMNKLQDRFDVMDETGLVCLNWSDVKIGEEWNRLDYMKALGITDEKHTQPDKVSYPFGKKFKQFFPKTMKFETPDLKKFIKYLGDQYVLAQKQEFPITIGKTTYTIAKGGIHSTEKNRAIVPPPGWIYRDADVGSQYPNSIVKLEIYAPHLNRLLLEQYQGKIKLRITYKNKAGELKTEGKTFEARKFESIQGLLKLCLNGGYYGKLGQKGSWLEFPDGLLKVCMGNQIEILMAIEAMELAGFQVLSGNTDGFTTMFPADQEAKYKEICAEWEKQVGNFELGKLEYVDYVKMYQRDINNYIGQYRDAKGNLKIKKKGKFVTSYGSPGCEMNKNKSKRIIPLALEAYFMEGKSPVDFIRGHENIYDFLIGLKASGKMHYEEEWEENGKIKNKVHKKLVVCYVSTEGTVLMKRGLNNEGKPMNNHCFAKDKDAPQLGQPLVKYFNEPFFASPFSAYNVNYNFYIYETLRIIDNIEKTKKTQEFLKSISPVVQTQLF